MGIRSKPWFCLPILFLFSILSSATPLDIDTLYAGQSLSGNQTLISQNGNFELGFFKPGKLQYYYVGIWYSRDPLHTVVWVANRNNPLSDPSSSKLKLFEDGNLVIFDSFGLYIWNSSISSFGARATEAVLLDHGNLVLRDGTISSELIWQSFDDPTDTWLPGARLHRRQSLSSWKNSDDPTEGDFSLKVYTNNSILYMSVSSMHGFEGSNKQLFRIPEIVANYVNFSSVSKEDSCVTYSVSAHNISRIMLDVSGQVSLLVWLESSKYCRRIWSPQTHNYCSQNTQNNMASCECLRGFEPIILDTWIVGCVRKSPLQCNNGGKDVFLSISPALSDVVNFPSFNLSTLSSIKECKKICMSNCSCMAYAYDGTCSIWKDDPLNLQHPSSTATHRVNLYYRVAASEIMHMGYRDGTKKVRIIGAIMGGIVGFIILAGVAMIVVGKCRRRQLLKALEAYGDSLVLFRYRDLRFATKNFSEKMGEGGFGSVFRGMLPNLAVIAVKKLETIRKGEEQFRNEISTIGVIQHVNLVRLRGFCAEGTKRFLVYEYMQNRSLDTHLFGKNSKVLDWKIRYQILLGSARGLAYLHEKCRECIIHCDIKPGNILLDAEFNAKVADFGLAKLFGRDFSRALTTMRGTRGYLAPEWISGEAITPKVDVYSYGMMLFEVISSRRNLDISEDGMVDYFPARAADKTSKGGDVISLLDYRLEGHANIEELTRACRVASWCIQDDEKDRPAMIDVVRILEGVLEVGIPPIPGFLQIPSVTESPAEGNVSKESYCNVSSQAQIVRAASEFKRSTF